MNLQPSARRTPLLLLFMLLLSPATATAQSGAAERSTTSGGAPAAGAKPAGGILDLDIEQLAQTPVVVPSMDIEVTSVDKHESTVGKSPAAIYVITSEMIHRSAANNIPDLLRLVPGVEVARANADCWAISIRGPNDRYANKILVLIDGRSVFSPVLGGVYWDVQDMLLEDIERIEVIRGPGGTLWGENAVNGVINIITKSAKDTQGVLVTYGGGTEDRALGGARVGGTIGKDLHYRIYGKHREEAAGFDGNEPAGDDWRQGRAGFRADWEPNRDKADLLTVQGDVYRGTDGIFGEVPFPNDEEPYTAAFAEGEYVGGGNILGRMTHTFDETSDWSLQTYYDRADRYNSFWSQKVGIFDVDFQNRFPLGERHDITWGSEYRQTHDTESPNGFLVGFVPPRKTTWLFSMFVQDQITLVEDRWFFTLGSKFERDPYTGFECQPSVRLLFTPSNKRSFWGAISRAVAPPSRYDAEGYFTTLPQDWPFPPPDVIYPRQYGRLGLEAQALVAYEIGYRAQPRKEFSYDMALFYYDYDKLRTNVAGTPTPDPVYGVLIYPLTLADTVTGHAYGGEINGLWAPSEKWRVSSSYSYARFSVLPSRNPYNQVRLMPSWDLGGNWQFDTIFRYVDSILGTDVPHYIEMDLRLAWKPRKHMELSVIARNLLQNHHEEYAQDRYPFHVTEVERSVYGCVTWRY